MTVTSVHKDPEALTMTIAAEFDTPIGDVWQLWANPRLLERWWGPPTYPATFVDHDLRAGGRATYFMTGPEGETPRGWWRVLDVEAPHRLVVEDGFADDDFSANPAMPTMMMRVSLHERAGGGTRMAIETTFASADAMEQILAMGAEEGMVAAMSQIDGLLAEVAAGGRSTA